MEHVIAEYMRQHRTENLNQLKEWLAIPSISALPEHNDDMQRGAQWIADHLEKIGMENVKVYETDGHPVVYGDWLKAEGKPTALIYGHYDVQPVDPVELWHSPPFEAEVRDEKLYARGASDDKGQVFMHLKVLEAILRTRGTLPMNFKFCIEGEEEIGSANLPKFIEENTELLSADVIVISDTGMLDRGKPAICYGLRGLAALQIDVKGANSDLHSGLYGGAVQNALHAITEILASFRDGNGRILVDGFYENVQEMTQAEKEAFAALNMSEEPLKKQLEVKELFGEKGYTHVEQTWVRPTLEVNGIWGGFQGEGIKTVLPNEAHAKISCRLVPDQQPDEIVEKLKRHIAAHTPPGVEVSVKLFDKGAPYVTPLEHPAIQAGARAYEKVYGVPTAFTRGGGSIPIVATFDELLKLPVVLMGFGLATENFHAPNEHFHLENFDKGMETLAHYWYELEEALQKEESAV
ncbi:dipeptidase [Fictibacillus aquaticus]|uniref:Peptidase M20 n=1 Tax=Fictibacillus aquaticus TaxID=2021314 RepID=A0A235F7I0_9BACL|nr:dipeptidase [Fictibacillus aquaticus]OYD57311.1 peptidase M20 [Fictibacillus aquaticus]